MVEGVLFNGAEDHLLASPGLSIGDGDDGTYLVVALHDGVETFDGKVWGSEIDYSHDLGDRFFERKHLEGCDSTFDTFVAMFSTGAIKGLLHGVGGENAENNWAFVLDGDVSDTLRHGLAYELKMASLALDDTSDTDDSIRIL